VGGVYNSFNLGLYGYGHLNPLKFRDPDGNVAVVDDVVVGAAVILVGGTIYIMSNPENRKAMARAAQQGAENFKANVQAASEKIKNLIFNESSESTKPAEGAAPAAPGEKPTTLEPGPHAGDSIPARGKGRDFTPEERGRINDAGQTTGCHTCGTKQPGTKSGNFVPDHQPPSAVAPENAPQRLYPQCLNCSRTQGGEIRGQQQQVKPPANE
jgi:hypothetical protein